jgi:hypothetical protein
VRPTLLLPTGGNDKLMICSELLWHKFYIVHPDDGCSILYLILLHKYQRTRCYILEEGVVYIYCSQKHESNVRINIFQMFFSRYQLKYANVRVDRRMYGRTDAEDHFYRRPCLAYWAKDKIKERTCGTLASASNSRTEWEFESRKLRRQTHTLSAV